MSTEQKDQALHALLACASTVLGLAAAFALGCWTQWQRAARNSSVKSSNLPVIPPPREIESPPVSTVAGPLPTPNAQNQALAGALVDFADEISDLQKSGGQETTHVLNFAAHKIEALLEAAGAELIRSADWNPQLQRAVEVRPPLSGQKENEIVARGASGLRVNGQLIRKQEVILARRQQ